MQPTEMQPIVVMYLAYAALSVGLTIWVAQTLSRNGRVFLVDVFGGNDDLADAVNRLLVVGFYLINLGYVALALRTADQVETTRAAVETLSYKVGLVLLVLGGMHLMNVLVFSRVRSRALGAGTPPPVRPDELLGPDEGQAPCAV